VQTVLLPLRRRPEAVWFSPADSKYLAIFTVAGGLRVWDAATGRAVSPALRQAWAPVAVAFPAEREVELVDRDGLSIRWELPAPGGRVLAGVKGVPEPDATPPGPLPWTCVLGDGITVRVSEAKAAGPLEQGGMEVTDVVFSPDGRRVAVAEAGGVRVWDVRHPGDVPLLLYHATPVTRAAFSPDGRYLAVATEAPGVRVWDVNLREPLTPLLRPPGDVVGLAFPEATRVLTRLTRGKDDEVREWDLRPAEESPAELERQARVLAGRRLGQEGSGQRLTTDEMRAALAGWQPYAPAPGK
jgi:WD40 repeat protein